MAVACGLSLRLGAGRCQPAAAPVLGGSRLAAQRGRQQQQGCCRLLAAGRGPGGWAPPTNLNAWEGAASADSEEEDEAELDLFPPEAQGDPEFVIENLLALVLIGLAALAVGNILLKLIIVACSLVSAAVRYTAIGIFLAVCVTGFQPGRWWF